MALLYDLAGRPQDLAEITTDMCSDASNSPDGELRFFSKKNKVDRIAYLSKRTVGLCIRFIENNGLKAGEKLFAKPNKNL